MALIPCPECGQQISDKAVSCPRCGNPMRTETPKSVEPPPPETTIDKETADEEGQYENIQAYITAQEQKYEPLHKLTLEEIQNQISEIAYTLEGQKTVSMDKLLVSVEDALEKGEVILAVHYSAHTPIVINITEYSLYTLTNKRIIHVLRKALRNKVSVYDYKNVRGISTEEGIINQITRFQLGVDKVKLSSAKDSFDIELFTEVLSAKTS